MAKFNTQTVSEGVTSPIQSFREEGARTFEGGQGYRRDSKSELFLLAVQNFVGESTFYEAAEDRDERYRSLIKQVAAEDPEWVVRFVPYLRLGLFMRSASVVAAIEFALSGAPGSRKVVNLALQRADEPGEALAYWHSRYGRTEPTRVKRGIADAIRRLYTERAALKYDGAASHAWRMGDVIDRVHPVPKNAAQSGLFRYLLDRKHNRRDIPETLGIIQARLMLSKLPVAQRRAFLLDNPDNWKVLRDAGFTWEALSGWIQGPMDAAVWEAIIPSMGYMALLRNLRNFDEAGISDEVAAKVAAKLSDPDEVARSMQFLFRFHSAWKATKSVRWGPVLETALGHSLKNIPSLPGRTLILADVSGSMFGMGLLRRSAIERWEMAALFAAALGIRAEQADVFAYSDGFARMDLRGADVLRSINQFRNWPGANSGTDTFGTLDQTYAGHDRVIILTDEQAHPAYFGSNPDPSNVLAKVPMLFTFNLAGYKHGHAPSGVPGRYTFGGLNDKMFVALPLIERGERQDWPF